MQAFFSYNDRIKTILEDTTMKVSVIQMNMRSLESKANFDRAEALVRRAVGENGPDVVVLPETWNTGFMPAGDLAAACDENAKAVRARFSPLARELNVNIVAGSVSNLRNGKIYNTACVFDRAGACIAEYDKTHPFTPMGEHEVYTPGDHLVTFTLDSVRCGLLICYEVRFPELWRTLALRGAQVMFLPAQWTAARQYHWETLTAARAIENQLFLVSCNQIIRQSTRDHFRHSLVLHASPLPHGRGMSPHIWQVLEGATKLTLTLLNAEDEVDSGDIWLQREFEVPPTALYDEINARLFDAEVTLMHWALENCDTARPRAQYGQPTIYRRRRPQDNRIDPERSLGESFDLMRVADPDRYPAFFEFRGQKYRIRIDKL